MIRIAVAAASDVARAALAGMIGAFAEMEVVARASDADSLVRSLRSGSIEAVVIDLAARDEGNAALLSAALGWQGQPAVVALGGEAADVDAAARSRGAIAMLPRAANGLEVETAIRAAIAGLIVTHPDLVNREAHVASTAPAAEHASLTPREIEVLRMLAIGLPNKTIALRLGVSAHTVKFHVGSIMTKLHAASRTEAVTEGIRRGLIFV
jgi:two-component system, NarL family, response regulator YdfI